MDGANSYNRSPAVVTPLNNIKAKYRTILSVPTELRPEQFKTPADFARYFNLPVALLKQWEMEPGFWDSVFTEAQAVVGRAMADVMQSLARRAKSGNIQAIKLSLEVLGVHHDKMEVQHRLENDQVILVLPPGMELPELPKVTPPAQSAEVGAGPELSEMLTQTHLLDGDMEFILDDIDALRSGAGRAERSGRGTPRLNSGTPGNSEMYIDIELDDADDDSNVDDTDAGADDDANIGTGADDDADIDMLTSASAGSDTTTRSTRTSRTARSASADADASSATRSARATRSTSKAPRRPHFKESRSSSSGGRSRSEAQDDE